MIGTLAGLVGLPGRFQAPEYPLKNTDRRSAITESPRDGVIGAPHVSSWSWVSFLLENIPYLHTQMSLFAAS